MAELFVGLAALILRVIVGFLFTLHGYPKLFKDFAGTANFLAGLGFKPGKFWAFVVGVTEFFGGLALIFGFLTRFAAVFLFINMAVALLVNKYKFNKKLIGGYELDLLLLAAIAALFFLGAGIISVDGAVGWVFG